MESPFFFFGTLRDPLILQAVLGRDLAHLQIAPAAAPGYRIERALGYSFPLLVEAPGSSADGDLVFGLTPDDIARIAYFEDSKYVRQDIVVEHGFGQINAHVYAASGKLETSGEPWELADFQRGDRALLLAVTRFVMTEHYGATPQAVMEQIWGSVRDRIARELDPNGSA